MGAEWSSGCRVRVVVGETAACVSAPVSAGGRPDRGAGSSEEELSIWIGRSSGASFLFVVDDSGIFSMGEDSGLYSGNFGG